MEEKKGLLIKATMAYGLAMGLFWVVKYLFFIFGLSFPSLILVYWVLNISVPFVAYYMTQRYKSEIGGKISFFHAWRFGIMLYSFAALIFSIEHFVFYQFIAPPDFISKSMDAALDLFKTSQVSSDLIESIGLMNFTPIHMAIQGIFNNIFYGIVFSIPVAALLCRNNGGSVRDMAK